MSLFTVFEIFLAILCFVVFVFLAVKHDGIIPTCFPFVGMLPDLLLNTHRIPDWSTAILQKTHCTFLFKGPWFSNMDMLITSDPSNVHYVFSSNFSNFPKGPEFKEFFDILGDGIFNADSDLWRSQRRAAQVLMKHHSFHQFLVKTSQSILAERLIPVLDHISDGSPVDLQDVFQRFTFDSICMLVNGYSPGCLSVDFPEVEFAKALDDAEEAIFFRHIRPQSFLKLQRWLNVGKEKNIKIARRILDETISTYIHRKKEELNRKGIMSSNYHDHEEGMDLLTSYMTKEKELGIEVDDQYLRDTILSFMLAGRDTTSSALTWFFWLLSKNPQAEIKILEELKSKVPMKEEYSSDKRRVFEIEEVKNLVYLHGALSEALRLYPPVPMEHKEPLQPDTLPSGHHVIPTTKILFSFYAMGRMESIWGEDCLEFRPERWVSERGGIKHEPSFKFVAFNAGPRTCLGKEMAWCQMKAVAATIVYNYRVGVVEGHPVVAKGSIILHMKHGLRVKVTSRLPVI
ncbi:hypothetical protein SLE2022_365880 [Rubroshorea leprosula]